MRQTFPVPVNGGEHHLKGMFSGEKEKTRVGTCMLYLLILGAREQTDRNIRETVRASIDTQERFALS